MDIVRCCGNIVVLALILRFLAGYIADNFRSLNYIGNIFFVI